MAQHSFFPIIWLAVVWLSLGAVQAQSSAVTSSHELGLRISTPSTWGLLYKQSLRSGRYWRLRAVSSNVVYRSDIGAQGNFSALLGLETRKQIEDHELSWYHGPEVGLIANMRQAFVNEGLEGNLSLRFNYLLGLRYDFMDWLWVEVETTPGIFIGYNPSQNDRAITIGASLSSSIAALTLGARFN